MMCAACPDGIDREVSPRPASYALRDHSMFFARLTDDVSLAAVFLCMPVFVI